MDTVKVGLPGRGAEFWLWATQHDLIDCHDVLLNYLETLKEKQTRDIKTNEMTAIALTQAKRCGALALGITIFVAVLTAFLNYGGLIAYLL